MRGNITRRGKSSWRLKFDLGRDPLTGTRKITYQTVRGTRADADKALVAALSSANAGDHVEPSKLTLADYLDQWFRDRPAGKLANKTAERYRQLADNQIIQHIGAAKIQALRPTHFSGLYGKLAREGLTKTLKSGRTITKAPVGARTIGHVHRLLHKAFADAVRLGLVTKNPVVADLPRAAAKEREILTLEQVCAILESLRGAPFYYFAVVAIFTGLRRGEIAALTWGDLDLDAGTLTVRRSLEETKAGLTFKSPKTRHGARTVAIAAAVVRELRDHWKAAQELRLALGMGRGGPDALLFHQQGKPDAPVSPDAMSKLWRNAADALNLTPTLHDLRHLHASALIRAGQDVVTVSRRLGHANATTTLKVYAHLFNKPDKGAAEAVEDALGAALKK